MNERKGWLLIWIGAGLFFLAWLGCGLAAFAWSSAFIKGMLN